MALTEIITGILLGLAVLIAFLSCVGVLAMRNAFQRLQFASAVVAFCPVLIAMAVWMGHRDASARIKVLLVGLVLLVMNSVLATATAKATRIHETSHWEPHADEKIPIVGRDEIAGSRGSGEEHRA